MKRLLSAAALALLAPALAAQTAPPWSTGTYAYDGTGNIKTIGTDGYQYDAFGRLLHGDAGAGRSQDYTYDRFGNLKTITTDGNTGAQIKLGVSPTSNRIDNTNAPYNAWATYDSDGRVTSYLGNTFAYDAVNMPNDSTVDGQRRIYLYSAADERIASVAVAGNPAVKTEAEWTLRDPNGQVLRRFSESNAGTLTWHEDYIYRSGQMLAAEVDGLEKTLHFHLDHLGTPRLVTGNGGAKISEHKYYAFGLEATSPFQDAERRKFTGHERDANNLDYMHARYYTPQWGRFLAVDPVVDVKRAVKTPQMWNRYAYVMNNAINRIDPDGRLIWILGTAEQRLKAFEIIRSGLREQDRQYVTMDSKGIISVDPNVRGGLGLTLLRTLAGKDVQTVRVSLGSTAQTKDGPGPRLPATHDLQAGGGGVTVPARGTLSGNIEVTVDPRGGFSPRRAGAWLVMAHELLGHAWDLVYKGTTSERSAVTTETDLLRDFGLPQFRPIPNDQEHP